jgi:hypothetical protein
VKDLQAATSATVSYNGADAAPLLAALQPLLAD